MSKRLSQLEVDTLVDALNTLKSYADDNNAVTEDILKNQVVLTQKEIDGLIATLSDYNEAPTIKTNVNVTLSQGEIDSLIDALNSIKQYDSVDALDTEISTNQSVLSQLEIDKLLATLLSLKKD